MYDPLLAPFPASKQAFPDSYWFSTAKDIVAKETLPILTDTIDADVAIIGGGYTGLSAAIHLAKAGIKPVLLEANDSGWGCSGRNGGFVLGGTGRLGMSAMQKKWGNDTASAIYQEFQTSIDTVQSLIDEGNIECDKIVGGYMKLAHNASMTQQLQQQADALSASFSESVSFVPANEVKNGYINTNLHYGGLYYPKCFAINPLKLARGYQRLALSHGATLYGQSPVKDWQQSQGQHQLITPQGQVNAKQVIIATNGYTGNALHPLVNNRHFPVISSIIVTRPLSSEELQAIGMKSGLMAMDTRSLKYYYRLLPDNRLLFGGRGAIAGKNADKALYRQRLETGLASTFPRLSNIDIDYFWSGWISVSLDDYPRLWHSDDRSIHYAMGYCGSGVAFGAQAGKRLAQMVTNDKTLPSLPYWQSPLKTFPFAAMRRLGLSAFYVFANMFNH
ncbi:FAD-binding oxidoreductase [Aestuariibacter sp. AA17]|uniref:FAD-binding oxidoreductase n=1 Tax=Fluctibacter corallii TaxID=2984329 RepID=A0ABT3A521_9ALTE|nr:FAD-dependent oxidoreductase [Aestuariibacter sp. AA17]MCV2883708.1 FAD-binding oxidoreductase [Aestuariibacter sp. AA17]